MMNTRFCDNSITHIAKSSAIIILFCLHTNVTYVWTWNKCFVYLQEEIRKYITDRIQEEFAVLKAEAEIKHSSRKQLVTNWTHLFTFKVLFKNRKNSIYNGAITNKLGGEERAHRKMLAHSAWWLWWLWWYIMMYCYIQFIQHLYFCTSWSHLTAYFISNDH